MTQGYYVAGAGKIFHGEGDLPNWHAWRPFDREPQSYTEGLLGRPVPEENMIDNATTTWAIDTLKRTNNTPTFMAVGYVRPHLPMGRSATLLRHVSFRRHCFTRGYS